MFSSWGFHLFVAFGLLRSDVYPISVCYVRIYHNILGISFVNKRKGKEIWEF